MIYAIELYYDEKTEEQLYSLANVLRMQDSAQSLWNGERDLISH